MTGTTLPSIERTKAETGACECAHEHTLHETYLFEGLHVTVCKGRHQNGTWTRPCRCTGFKPVPVSEGERP